MSSEYPVLFCSSDRSFINEIKSGLKADDYIHIKRNAGRINLNLITKYINNIVIFHISKFDDFYDKLFDMIRKANKFSVIIVLSDVNDIKSAVYFIKKNAYDYIIREGDYLSQITNIISQIRNNEVCTDNMLADNYKSILDNSIDGIMIVQEYKIKFVNDIILKTSGYSREDFLDEKFTDFFAADEHKKILTIYEKLLKNQASLMHDNVFFRFKDGSMHWLELFASNIQWRFKPAILVCGRDNSEKKAIEDRLRKEDFNRNIRNKVWDLLTGIDIKSENQIFQIIFGLLGEIFNPSRILVFKLNPSTNDLEFNAESEWSRHDEEKAEYFFKIPYDFWVKYYTRDYLILTQKLAESLIDSYKDNYLKVKIRKDLAKNKVKNFLILPYRINEKFEGFISLGWTFANKNEINYSDINIIINEIIKIIEISIARFRNDKQLKNSEETLRALLNGTQDWAMLLDNEGKVLAVNDIVTERLGITSGELMNKYIFDYFPPDLAYIRKKAAEQIKITKKPVSFEEVHRYNTYYTTISPILDDKNEIVKLAIYAHEITDYKMAVKTALESEEKFRALIENSSDCIFILDQEGNIIYSSLSVENILGYKPGEVIGKSFFDFIYLDDIPVILSKFIRVIKNAVDKQNLEFRIVNREGKIIFIEGIGSNLYDNPIVSGFVINFRDITERKLTESDLKMYKYIVDSTSDLLIFIDNYFNILVANAAFLKAFGETYDGIKGKRLEDICGKEEFVQFYKLKCEQCLVGVEVKAEKWFEFPVIGKKFIDISFYPFLNEKNSSYSGIVISMRDITDKFELEEEMVEIQEKEQNRIGMELHDGLNHTLLGIAIRAKVLGFKLNKLSMNESNEAFEIESLINKSIEESRNIASGLFPINLEKRKFKDVLLDIKENLKNNFSINCNVTYDDFISEIKNLKILVQFYYILSEAVRNAVKHSKCRNINIKFFKEKNKMVLIIEDDGLGISESSNKGMGINLMKYRARIIGALLNVNKRDKSVGTEVYCELNIENFMLEEILI